ncbi:Nn.00g088380.m01.CDS01 [Neocucurbitaria sp. VM-36]
MALHVASSAIIESFHVDSGYISDTLGASPSGAKSDVILQNLSPSYHDLDITSVAFDDTEWNFPTSEVAESSTLRLSSHRMEDLTPIKLTRPKRFPIIPLESTLSRARNEAKATFDTNKQAVVRGRVKKPRAPVKTKSLVVDSHGRTRAAKKILTLANVAKPPLPMVESSSRKAATANTKTEKKRRRGTMRPSDQRKLN